MSNSTTGMGMQQRSLGHYLMLEIRQCLKDKAMEGQSKEHRRQLNKLSMTKAGTV